MMGRTLTVTLRLTLTQLLCRLFPHSPNVPEGKKQRPADVFCKFRTFCRRASNVTFFSGVRFWHAASRLISVTESWQFDKFQINRLLLFWNQSKKQMIPMIKVLSHCFWHLTDVTQRFFLCARCQWFHLTNVCIFESSKRKDPWSIREATKYYGFFLLKGYPLCCKEIFLPKILGGIRGYPSPLYSWSQL